MPRSRDTRRAIIEALGLVRRAQMEARKGVARLARIADKVEGGREILVSLETLNLVLERVALRLNTLLATGVITPGLLAPIAALVKELYEESRDLGPGISQALSELDDILEALYTWSSGGHPSIAEDAVRAEARMVIEEARREAEKKVGGLEELGV